MHGTAAIPRSHNVRYDFQERVSVHDVSVPVLHSQCECKSSPLFVRVLNALISLQPSAEVYHEFELPLINSIVPCAAAARATVPHRSWSSSSIRSSAWSCCCCWCLATPCPIRRGAADRSPGGHGRTISPRPGRGLPDSPCWLPSIAGTSVGTGGVATSFS